MEYIHPLTDFVQSPRCPEADNSLEGKKFHHHLTQLWRFLPAQEFLVRHWVKCAEYVEAAYFTGGFPRGYSRWSNFFISFWGSPDYCIGYFSRSFHVWSRTKKGFPESFWLHCDHCFKWMWPRQKLRISCGKASHFHSQ